MGIPINRFVESVEEIAGEHPRYRLGGYGRDGTCDCIGLTIGAIRRAGGQWPGTHGSNYAARNEIDNLRNITVADMVVGMQVLKARPPGAAGYSLPSKYTSSGDRLDYYHAGVVTSVNPLIITHSTGTGTSNSIVRDSKQGKWLYGGMLKRVDYLTQEPATENKTQDVTCTATVSTGNGLPLKLRAQPTKSCRLYWRIPDGATVVVIERDTGSDGWAKCSYNGKTGYCLDQFLKG